MADFETTTKLEDCRVWGYGVLDLDLLKDEDEPPVEIGDTLDEFMYRIDADNAVIFFHNLKFDGHFIIDWLFKHDFYHVQAQGNIAPQCFKTLISDGGQFYTITIRFASGVQVELRDSLKKLPFTVARIAVAFKLGEVKGDIDYNLERPEGWKITPEERDYITRDIRIPAKALKTILDSGAKKLTVGSDALAEFKNVIGIHNFKRLFPVFQPQMDAEIRRAYRGGFTYADPRFTRERTGEGAVYDVNSLYPSVMYHNAMPYGEPQFVPGVVTPTKARPLCIFSVTFTAKLKRDHIPCIQIKGNSRFAPTEYLRTITEPTTLMVTDVDWKLYNDHYDIEVLEYGGGWRFRSVTGVFKEYIDKWSKIKAESTGAMRELAKLMLNSLYGKFASNPSVRSKFPYLAEDGSVKYRKGPDEQRAPVYTAVGVYITSYARDLTIRAAQAHYDVFAYADTDSLHLLTTTPPPLLEIHPSKLGAWKHEYDFDSAMYLRSKAYLERHTKQTSELVGGVFVTGPTYTNRIAGLPERISGDLRFDDVRPGAVIHGKLVPKSVPGGIVLVNTPYELNY